MNLLKKFIRFYQSTDGILFWPMSASVILALFLSIISLIYFQYLPSQLPIFLSLPWGESQLAPTSQIVILPSIIFLIILVNLIISWHLHTSQKVIKRIVYISTLLISLIIFTAGIKIIFTFI